MANEEMRRAWIDGAAGWVDNQAVLDAAFAPVTAAIIEAAAPRTGQRLLDVGCGSGTLLAAAAAAGARVVGVDIADPMSEAADRRVPEATVLVADAQSADLLGIAGGPPFDRVVSRFGVMFFEDPQAAFANIRKAAAPLARLVFACWRGKDENPIFTAGSSVLSERLDPGPEPAAPGAPGPTAFADPARPAALLAAAGWSAIEVEPLDFTCVYGADGGDGVEERLAAVLGTGTGRLARERLLPVLGPEGWEELLEEVRVDLRRYRTGGKVAFPGAAWLVTAANV